jgi:hypothetical protein
LSRWRAGCAGKRDEPLPVVGKTFGRASRLGGPGYVLDSTIGDFTYIGSAARTRASSAQSLRTASSGLATHPTNLVSTHPLFYRHQPELGYDLVERDRLQELSRTWIGNDE